MKIPVVFYIAVLLVTLIPRDDCWPLLKPASTNNHRGPQSELQYFVPLVGNRLLEEYLKALTEANNKPTYPAPNLHEVVAPDGAFQVPLIQFQRTRHGKVGDLNSASDKYQHLLDALLERGKRRETHLLSLNVPLHVLNKLIGIAKVEQMARQAEKNRKIMDAVGK
ncbi:UI-like [Leucoraja erinacea]|uniref:UI-like n=1 Tax=Leucoraja erinaceus TaxID=7782 RepID=UPI0024587EA1|nr:UI-like [Leucoraja erinacea]